MSVQVRLFAGAADVAGATETTVAGTTIAEICEALDRQFGDSFAAVRRQCSLMVDGERRLEHESVAEGSTLDVLPPFVGG